MSRSRGRGRGDAASSAPILLMTAKTFDFAATGGPRRKAMLIELRSRHRRRRRCARGADISLTRSGWRCRAIVTANTCVSRAEGTASDERCFAALSGVTVISSAI
jgi:hypothetical protein